MAISNLMRVSRSHNLILTKFKFRQLSAFADLKKIAADYDKYRKPVGVELMHGMTEFYTNKKAKDLHILDAGCGTGIYTRSMFDMGVGKMALLDASADMLSVAREKFAVEIKANKVSAIAQTSLPKIPFDDGTFDAVLLNTVLHHLPSGSGRNFFHAVETLKEARRVLQPDGVIAITLLLDTSSTNAWFLNLSPEILDKICSVSLSAEEWNKMFFAAGLKCLLKTNLHGFGLLGDEDYIEYNNIFKQEWRNSIVMFEHTTKEEIERVSQKVKSLHMKGEIKGWIKDHDKTQQFGFISLFLCQ